MLSKQIGSEINQNTIEKIDKNKQHHGNTTNCQ